jgi:hypothetical protein
MDEFTDTFIKALERLEAENDVELIAGLFSENATLSNPKGTQDAGFTKSRTRISVSRGHRFQKVRDSEFSKSRTEATADLDRIS